MGRSERGISFASRQDDTKGLIILSSAEIDVPGKGIGLNRNRVQTLANSICWIPSSNFLVRQNNAEQRVGSCVTRTGGDGLAEVFLRLGWVPVGTRNYAEHH